MSSSAPTPDENQDNEGDERAGGVPRFVFTREERELCRTLVVRYRAIVENKASGNFANRQKDDAWKKITEEYNSQEGIRPVTVAKLRKLWDNEKTRWKKRQAENTRDLYATGKYLTVSCLRD